MSTAGGCATARDCTIGAPVRRPRRFEEARVRLPHERFDYSPITARRPWRLPKGADRKSTRLNSSHGYISYAVFCLKKKKKKHRHHLSFDNRYERVSQ